MNWNSMSRHHHSMNFCGPFCVLSSSSGQMKDNEEEAVIVINVSPLEFGNSLLVPNVTANIPQRITQEGIDLLVRLMLLSTDV